MKTSPATERQEFTIVGIGGSAGGLTAYRALLAALPGGTGMAFVIVAHLAPHQDSLLPQILSWSTRMPVVEAADGMAIEPEVVFVIPPDANLLLTDGHFRIQTPRTLAGHRHHQVDVFLISLAHIVGPRAIAVILSGGDGDGTEGCKAVKAGGGVTFAQDLSAEVGSMPLSAQASGSVDYVMSPLEIAETLAKICATRTRAAVVA